MKRGLLIAGLILAGLAALALRPARAGEKGTDGGWVKLFNGKDLGGWKNYGDEKWTVQNGEILGEAVTKA